jgi:hypothetical protein
MDRSQTAAGARRRRSGATAAIRTFEVKATTWKGEVLTEEVEAKDARQARRLAIHDFMWEGINVLQANASKKARTGG